MVSYDAGTGVLSVESRHVPSEIHLHVPNERDREPCSARVWKYAPIRTAVREVRSYGNGVGTCTCSICKFEVGPFDSFCKACGSKFVDTDYERIR